MASRLEIRGHESWNAKATCQVASNGHAFEIFVTDGGDSYMLIMTPEEIYRLAQARYGAPEPTGAGAKRSRQ
jgi:hypothetical protein